jgi:hypothetical protein
MTGRAQAKQLAGRPDADVDADGRHSRDDA